MNQLSEKRLQSNEFEQTGLSSLKEPKLTNKDVCKILSISSRTLQTYRDKNILPFAQIGRKIYYKASDIDEYLEQHYIKSNCQRGTAA
jgi:MerR family transcriptional regulator, repressor of the yfmOP operon